MIIFSIILVQKHHTVEQNKRFTMAEYNYAVKLFLMGIIQIKDKFQRETKVTGSLRKCGHPKLPVFHTSYDVGVAYCVNTRWVLFNFRSLEHRFWDEQSVR